MSLLNPSKSKMDSCHGLTLLLLPLPMIMIMIDELLHFLLKSLFFRWTLFPSALLTPSNKVTDWLADSDDFGTSVSVCGSLEK